VNLAGFDPAIETLFMHLPAVLRPWIHHIASVERPCEVVLYRKIRISYAGFLRSSKELVCSFSACLLEASA
jgi:hypothetical protein